MLSLLIGGVACDRDVGDPPLNLVFNSLDTLRADHLGCTGTAGTPRPGWKPWPGQIGGRWRQSSVIMAFATGGFTGGGPKSRDFGFDDGFDHFVDRGKRIEVNRQQTLQWLVGLTVDRLRELGYLEP